MLNKYNTHRLSYYEGKNAMRQITSHEANELNNALQIEVLHETTGFGPNQYLITVGPRELNPGKPESISWQIGFQSGQRGFVGHCD